MRVFVQLVGACRASSPPHQSADPSVPLMLQLGLLHVFHVKGRHLLSSFNDTAKMVDAQSKVNQCNAQCDFQFPGMMQKNSFKCFFGHH